MNFDKLKRTRITIATARRAEKMQQLVAELGQREMIGDDICHFLVFSPAGTRKYIHDLREMGVIELARHVDGTDTYLGKAVYRLTPDSARVRAFLVAIAQQLACKPAAPPHARHLDVAGRNFHIMADDANFPIRSKLLPVVRDPLVEALFGAGPAVREAA